MKFYVMLWLRSQLLNRPRNINKYKIMIVLMRCIKWVTIKNVFLNIVASKTFLLQKSKLLPKHIYDESTINCKIILQYTNIQNLILTLKQGIFPMHIVCYSQMKVPCWISVTLIDILLVNVKYLTIKIKFKALVKYIPNFTY